MFNLGIKEIIINHEGLIKDHDGNALDAAGNAGIVVDGFYSSALSDATNLVSVAPAPAVLGSTTFTSPALTVGEVYSYKITVKSTGGNDRLLSDLFPYGEVLSGEIVSKSADIIADIGKDNLPGNCFEIVGTDTLTFLPGYEGFNIDKFEIVKVYDVTDGTVANPLRPTAVPVNTFVEGTVGFGQGKQLEAEVQNATWDNTNPYGVQFGGNTAVDVRGSYSMVYFESTASVDGALSNGWGSHEMLGRGDVQTTSEYIGRKYIIWVNSNLVGAAADHATYIVWVKNALKP